MKASLNIALLAAIVGAAHGHTMGMCTMTSPTIPNRAVVMVRKLLHLLFLFFHYNRKSTSL